MASQGSVKLDVRSSKEVDHCILGWKELAVDDVAAAWLVQRGGRGGLYVAMV